MSDSTIPSTAGTPNSHNSQAGLPDSKMNPDEIRAMDDADHAHEEGEAMTPKKIWNVFWILLVITTIEFFITLYLAPTFHWNPAIKAFILIALTLLKAFYIVGYFMHLKFERLNLIYCIAMPTILVLGLIAGLISEGQHWLLIR